MKRSAPMKRSRLKPKPARKAEQVSDGCGEYRKGISEFVCEVESYLKQDKDAAAYIARRKNEAPWLAAKLEIHHVFGKTGPEELNWFCSLIQVSAICHEWLTDNKFAGQLACLRSKLDRQARHEFLMDAGIIEPTSDERRLFWHTEAMDRCCLGGSLAGRIEGILLPAVRGTVFGKFAVEFLKELS